MTLPTAQTLYDVIDATWPAAAMIACGPFTLRSGLGGGNRVSAATAIGIATDDEIATAASAMRAMKQPALFMIRDTDTALDAQLANLGYEVKDPVTLYAAPIAAMTTTRPPHKTVFTAWPPLAAQIEIWEEGGIGAGRLAVMERAPMPKTTLLGRVNDRPAGTTYVGMSLGCAMIHALEVGKAFRRQGLAAHMTRAAAFWAADNGADFLALVTTRVNVGANALYTSLGMSVVGHYHYRIQPK